MPEPIDVLLYENRIFQPDPAFANQANVSDDGVYVKARSNPQGYWEDWAKELVWDQPWHTVLNWNRPFAEWFVGGKLNACYNCVDRHVDEGHGEKVAIIGEGEPGDIRTYTYAQVKDEVSRVANALKELGVARGDRVCIYMPMVPELVFTMLACARIGAPHTVVFGGFSAESLRERIEDTASKVVVCADGGWRRGKVIALKATVDQALDGGGASVQKVLVLKRVGDPGSSTEATPKGFVPDYDPGIWNEYRDVAWATLVDRQSVDCPCESMDAEDLLFILYTSGSTGKPKGIMHTTGGYLTQVYATTEWVFDIKDEDVYWCTADCGWVTGHSYVVYGPMANRATQVVYEGTPDSPDKDRFWDIVERHKVSILYTAPTAIRTFMKWGRQFVDKHDLSSLRLLGSVGEPINPEAWMWYRDVIGNGSCPVVDTWWQTETGAIMITPLPGLTPIKPGAATRAFPGIIATIYDDNGVDQLEGSEEASGYLVIKNPWPSMARGIYGDPQRFIDTYWSRFPDAYFPGDGAKTDRDGYFWLLGRVDDIMLVSGHNISTMEVESALVDHPVVAEAAVIGRTDDIKGQAVAAFVILRSDAEWSDEIAAELREHVGKKIGPIAKPDDLFIVAEVPKTRSGKIMRRLLRDVAEGRALGDVTTLSDPAVVQSLKDQYEEKE